MDSSSKMASKTFWVFVGAILVTVAAISVHGDYENEFDEENELEEYSERKGKIREYLLPVYFEDKFYHDFIPWMEGDQS